MTRQCCHPRNLSTAKGHGICMECLAGEFNAPFEEVSWQPAWLATSGLMLPWKESSPSPLCKIPGRFLAPHQIFRKDCFHIWKQTIGGHWVASGIVLLLDLGYWNTALGPQDADSLLQVAYRDYDYFMKNEWTGHQVSHCKMFTKALLHWPKQKMFPYTRIKGSDIMLCTRWFVRLLSSGLWDPSAGVRRQVSLIERPLHPSHVPLLRELLRGSYGALEFFRMCHTEGVWHDRGQAQVVARACYSFCEAYSQIAQMCHVRGLRRFHLEPSLHYYLHFAVDSAERLRQGHQHVMSPMTEGCEADEDFVGRLARLSRCVHARSVNQRTIERYLIKVRFVLFGEDYNSSGPSNARKKKLKRGQRNAQ